jgi:hypothetical protein
MSSRKKNAKKMLKNALTLELTLSGNECTILLADARSVELLDE